MTRRRRHAAGFFHESLLLPTILLPTLVLQTLFLPTVSAAEEATGRVSVIRPDVIGIVYLDATRAGVEHEVLFAVSDRVTVVDERESQFMNRKRKTGLRVGDLVRVAYVEQKRTMGDGLERAVREATTITVLRSVPKGYQSDHE